MRILLLLLLNLFIITTILAGQYISHVSVNLIKPITIKAENIDFGVYIIGSPKPQDKHTKIVVEDAELNKQINLSVNPSTIMSANGGHDTVELDISLSKTTLEKINPSQKVEADMTVSLHTLPKVPGNYTGTIIINADYN